MDLKQILIDRKQLGVFNLLDQVREIFTISNLELLLRVFILFHVETVLNNLIPFNVLFILWAPE